LAADKKRLERQVKGLSTGKAALADQLEVLKMEAATPTPDQSAPQQPVPVK